MSVPTRKEAIAEAKASGMKQDEDGEWYYPLKCDYCGEEATHIITAGDERIDMCEACYDHYN